jgi:hypothetical protein
MVVLRRKSCVIAIPIDAKDRDVRSQAKNVLSILGISVLSYYTIPYHIMLSLYHILFLGETEERRAMGRRRDATYRELNDP